MFALHHGREKPDGETQAIVIAEQLVAEITVTGGCGRRNDGYTVGRQRQRQFLIVVQNAVRLQTCQNLPAQTRHVAQRIGRIDVRHGQRIAIKFMKGDPDLDQNLQSRR